MTVADIGNGLWLGLSSDTKPSVSTGSRFFETDTGDTLLSDGTYWWLMGCPSILSPRRIGFLSTGPSITNGQIGLCSGLSSATGAGTQAVSFIDTTNGRYYTGVTGIIVGNRGGYRQGSIVSTRGMNAKIRFKFKLVTNTNQNFWLGFIGGGPTEPSGVDPFGSGSPGAVFGINSGLATNWAFMHNATTGATVVDNTSIAYDTNIHTVNIVADDANTRFAWNLDGGSYNFVTANIPSQTNGLGVVAEIEAEETVAKSFQLYEMSIQVEK